MNVGIFHKVNGALKFLLNTFNLIFILTMIVMIDNLGNLNEAMWAVRLYVYLIYGILLIVLTLSIFFKEDLEAAKEDGRKKNLLKYRRIIEMEDSKNE